VVVAGSRPSLTHAVVRTAHEHIQYKQSLVKSGQVVGLQNPNSHISHPCTSALISALHCSLKICLRQRSRLLAAGTWHNSTEFRLTNSGVAALQQVRQVPSVRVDPRF